MCQLQLPSSGLPQLACGCLVLAVTHPQPLSNRSGRLPFVSCLTFTTDLPLTFHSVCALHITCYIPLSHHIGIAAPACPRTGPSFFSHLSFALAFCMPPRHLRFVSRPTLGLPLRFHRAFLTPHVLRGYLPSNAWLSERLGCPTPMIPLALIASVCSLCDT